VARGGAPAWWLAAGLFAGLALVSKYTAAFLPIGLGLFVLFAAPRMARRVEPWLGSLIAGLVFLPVVVWNSQHAWVGILRQGGRIADWRPERAVGFLLELVGGQIGLATPGVFVLFAIGIVTAIRRARDPRWALLVALSVPPLLVFLQHAFGDRVQGNWPAIVYPTAAVAASAVLPWRRWAIPSCCLGFGIAALLYAHILTGWPATRDPVAERLLGWDSLAAAAEAARLSSGATFIAAEPYATAAELAWALAPETEVVGAGAHWQPTTLRRAEPGEGLGVLIRPQRYGSEPDASEWRTVSRLPDISRSNGGVEIERYAVFLVHSVGGPAGAILPHR
jgi:4-amino-4-deoxy-L-arabinose transferase-like glycosyltransferase